MNEFSKKDFRRYAAWSSLLLLLFTAAVNIFSAALSGIAPYLFDKSSDIYNAILQFICFLVQYLAVVPAVIFIMRCTPYGKSADKMKSLVRKPEQSAWWVTRWVIIVVGITFIFNLSSNIIITVINLLTNGAIHVVSVEIGESAFSRIALPFGAVILAPIFEEIMMRATIANEGKKYGTWSIIVINGILFALWHCNLGQTALAFALGMGCSFLLYKTKSIFPCIIAHFCLNLIGMVGSVVSSMVPGGTENMPQLIEQGIYLPAILTLVVFGAIMLFLVGGLVLLILEFILHRDSFKLSKVGEGASEVKKVLLYFTSPAAIVTVLFFLGITVYSNFIK